MFRAPARDGSGGLTAAELISRPAGAAGEPGPRRVDWMLLLPAFGLMFCGVAGVVVNSLLTYKFLADPDGSRAYIRAQLTVLRQYGIGKDDPPAEQDRLDDERAESTAKAMRWVLPVFAVVSAVAFVGGLSVALRWSYRLARLGCVAALLNVPHCCCVPGGIAGVWGLLMLGSEEGRAHFGA